MLKFKYNKNRCILSLLVLVITFSLTQLANSNDDSVNIKLETSTGEVLSIENSTNDFSAEVTMDTNSGYIFEIK